VTDGTWHHEVAINNTISAIRRSDKIQAKRTATRDTGDFTVAGNGRSLILLHLASQPCILRDITPNDESPAMLKDDLAA
jgi:hypothetical protein